jgi:hypothetical protein
MKETGGVLLFTVVLQDAVAGHFPISASCRRRMKEPMQMVLSLFFRLAYICDILYKVRLVGFVKFFSLLSISIKSIKCTLVTKIIIQMDRKLRD